MNTEDSTGSDEGGATAITIDSCAESQMFRHFSWNYTFPLTEVNPDVSRLQGIAGERRGLKANTCTA